MVVMSFLFLVIAGTIQNIFFVLAPISYLIFLTIAYSISGRINDHAINAMYNWSAKWSLFVIFLYLTASFIKEAFVFAMFSYILINTILSPMIFLSKNKVST